MPRELLHSDRTPDSSLQVYSFFSICGRMLALVTVAALNSSALRQSMPGASKNIKDHIITRRT